MIQNKHTIPMTLEMSKSIKFWTEGKQSWWISEKDNIKNTTGWTTALQALHGLGYIENKGYRYELNGLEVYAHPVWPGLPAIDPFDAYGDTAEDSIARYLNFKIGLCDSLILWNEESFKSHLLQMDAPLEEIFKYMDHYNFRGWDRKFLCDLMLNRENTIIKGINL